MEHKWRRAKERAAAAKVCGGPYMNICIYIYIYIHINLSLNGIYFP